MQKKDFKIEAKLYAESAISDSINDFSDFSIAYDNGILTISGKSDSEIEEIFNEFMNYVLGTQNEAF